MGRDPYGRLVHVDVVALTTGFCLAQAGEFSFVIATLARGEVIDDELFRMLVAATIVTLFLTPLLVASGPRVSRAIVARMSSVGVVRDDDDASSTKRTAHVILIGFGPAGQAVGESLLDQREQVVVLDLNPALARKAREYGFEAHVGDARQGTQLDHLELASARAVVVTIPDPHAARDIIRHTRATAPTAHIIARSRYHIHRLELDFAGADEIIDEEREVGHRLAEAVVRCALEEEGEEGAEGMRG